MIEQQPQEPSGEFLLYTTEDGQAKLEVRLVDETVWLSQAQLAELFQSTKQNISQHIKNLFEEGELQVESVVKDFLTTAADGKSYKVAHFNLDVCISVGYRVKSHRGTQFRIWATQRLREYLVKGFAMDDDRLKRAGGGNKASEGTEIAAVLSCPRSLQNAWARSTTQASGQLPLSCFPL